MQIKSLIKKCDGRIYALNPSCEQNAKYEINIPREKLKLNLCEGCLNIFKHLKRKTKKAEFFPGKSSSLASPNVVTGVKSFSEFGKNPSSRRKGTKDKENEKEMQRVFLKVAFDLSQPIPFEFINGVEVQRMKIAENEYCVFRNGKPLYIQDKYYKNIRYV